MDVVVGHAEGVATRSGCVAGIAACCSVECTANELLWNSTKNMEYTFAIPCWLYSIMLFHITIPCVLFHIESRFDTVTRPPRGGGWLGPTMGLKHIC